MKSQFEHLPTFYTLLGYSHMSSWGAFDLNTNLKSMGYQIMHSHLTHAQIHTFSYGDAIAKNNLLS